jgi:hypothetical protein
MNEKHIYPYPVEFIRLGPPEKTEAEMIADAKRRSAEFLKQIELHRKQQEKIMVRAKFYCNRISQTSFGYGPNARPMTEVSLTPVTTGSEEDKAFWEATPTGSLTMGILNEEAAKRFVLGKTYYLDFTPVE